MLAPSRAFCCCCCSVFSARSFSAFSGDKWQFGLTGDVLSVSFESLSRILKTKQQQQRKTTTTTTTAAGFTKQQTVPNRLSAHVQQTVPDRSSIRDVNKSIGFSRSIQDIPVGSELLWWCCCGAVVVLLWCCVGAAWRVL